MFIHDASSCFCSHNISRLVRQIELDEDNDFTSSWLHVEVNKYNYSPVRTCHMHKHPLTPGIYFSGLGAFG